MPLPDATFDLALSEYGASIWCDPYRWIPEAAALASSRWAPRLPLQQSAGDPCALDEQEATVRAAAAAAARDASDGWSDGGVDFHLGHGEMFRAPRQSGFDVENLIELYAPEDATTHEYYEFVTAEWARKWPAEEIWAARKSG